jgi:prophage regulatory protein
MVNLEVKDIKFLRLPKVLEMVPVSKSTWWAGVKSGNYPKPVKLSRRTTAWLREDIEALCTRIAERG